MLTVAQLHILCDIAVTAGREIMAVYAHGGETWKKDDDSPLTEADLRADAVIRRELDAAFPGTFILSEESVSAGPTTPEAFFLVDPLDGTREFLKRNDEFTVNIAFVQGGQPVAGVVYAPALGEMFYAAHGLGAWKCGADGDVRQLAVASRSAGDVLRVIGSRSHDGDKLAAWLSALKGEHSFVAAGSSLKFCRIAEGQADIYPRFGLTSQWDTAAAQCVLEVAGGCVTDLNGEPLRYGLDRPILNPEFVATANQSLLPLLSN